jgi:hypothetical protein
MTEPVGSTYRCVSSLSRSTKPLTSTGVAPTVVSSTQSPGVPPLDSTSLRRTGEEQSFAAPFVLVVVVANSPVPSGQRP